MRRTQKQRHARRHTIKHRPAWGTHLCVDAAGCDHAALCSKETIRAFVKELVKEIDMKAYGPPRIVRFGMGNKMGYTLVQLIETSDITAHFCEETNAIYLDVFSCKPFDPKTALRVFDKYFHSQRKRVRLIKRQA